MMLSSMDLSHLLHLFANCVVQLERVHVVDYKFVRRWAEGTCVTDQ
jgi:hypothetical protein